MGSPSVPAPVPTPQQPTMTQVENQEELRAREKSRRNIAAALNTRASMLAGDYYSDGKTMLGQ